MVRSVPAGFLYSAEQAEAHPSPAPSHTQHHLIISSRCWIRLFHILGFHAVRIPRSMISGGSPMPGLNLLISRCRPEHVHASMHPCIHASMHPCIHASMHPCIHASMHPCIHTSMHPCIHASMHPWMHACMHACIHPSTGTSAYMCVRLSLMSDTFCVCSNVHMQRHHMQRRPASRPRYSYHYVHYCCCYHN